MAAYTFSQLEQLWIGAGGSRAMAPTMAAIALAESGGNPQAHNASGASGLWQIMLPTNSSYVPGGAGNVYNPQANATAAVKIASSQGLGAWTTYTSGAYKHFLGGSSGGGGILGTIESALGTEAGIGTTIGGGALVTGAGSDVASGITSVGSGASGALSAVESGVSSLGSAAGSVGSFLSLLVNPQTWLKVLKFVAGAVLIFMALKSLTGVETPNLPAVIPV